MTYRGIRQFILLTLTLTHVFGLLKGQAIVEPVSGTTAAVYKPIDFTMLDQRLRLGYEGDVALSPDGKYCSYGVKDKPSGARDFVLRSVEGNWEHRLTGVPSLSGNYFFSGNSRHFVYLRKEVLYQVPLGGGEVRKIDLIGNCSWPKDGRGKWIGWQQKGSQSLMLKNVLTQQEQKIEDVFSFEFDKNGRWLACRLESATGELLLYDLDKEKGTQFGKASTYWISKKGGMVLIQTLESGVTSLRLWNPSTDKRTLLWSTSDTGTTAGSFVSYDGGQLAFVTSTKQADGLFHAIWYYGAGKQKAVQLADDRAAGIDKKLFIKNILEITTSKKHVYFKLFPKTSAGLSADPLARPMDIWSYRDSVFYLNQDTEYIPGGYTAVVDVSSRRVVQVEGAFEDMCASGGDYAVVVARYSGDGGDRFWKHPEGYMNWLVCLKDGTRRALPVKTPQSQAGDTYFRFFYVNASGSQVFYFDQLRGHHYYRYDIASGREERLSKGIPDDVLGFYDKFDWGGDTLSKAEHQAVGWLKWGQAILVYDNYDIWLVNLSGNGRMENLTRGYGRRNHIIFRICEKSIPDGIAAGQALWLTAFDENNDENGFYSLTVGRVADPVKLSIGPYCYDLYDHDLPGKGNMPSLGMHPVKAAGSSTWIVMRQGAQEMPNYYVTHDFSKFKALTKLRTDPSWNMPTAELVRFKQSNGRKNRGILYKPADFDAGKKYPVLVLYYMQYSYNLHQYPEPAPTISALLNVTWFTSRGYLVFCTDICFEKGALGMSAVQATEGASRYLSGLPYVDSHRIGISSHSFGGGLTNYIVTHSKLFAAAMEGAGVANRISGALQLTGNETEEKRRSRLDVEVIMGSSMWENPALWTDEMPVLHADQVVTPLLIFHCKSDGGVPFAQAVEMFTALRRLDKKVWLLQYDKGGHGVNGPDAQDLTLRIAQYFDHYLKGVPAPVWMTRGVPRWRRGIDRGLQLDSMSISP